VEGPFEVSSLSKPLLNVNTISVYKSENDNEVIKN